MTARIFQNQKFSYTQEGFFGDNAFNGENPYALKKL
jgi:hypothetical protein